MRAPAALAAFVLIAWSAGAAGETGPEETCSRSGGDLTAVIDCLGRIETARPYDDAIGRACASLDSEGFVRPAQGKTLLRYGQATQYGSRSRGVVIETRSSGQVVAPVESLVLFAGEFRSYGKLLILEPGCGVSVLIAGLAVADVVRGQLVLAGEPVGVMSRGSSLDGSMPVLYVELRRDQRPIDPGPGITGP